jgi:hypothetical protein
MKWLGAAVLAMALGTPGIALGQPPGLEGTWSGDWTPKDGIATAVTVTLTMEPHGKLTGKFLSPVPMEIASAAYDPKTHGITIDALDKSSGETYKLVGKVSGTDMTGTIDVGNRTGHVLLIKWTYTGIGFK